MVDVAADVRYWTLRLAKVQSLGLRPVKIGVGAWVVSGSEQEYVVRRAEQDSSKYSCPCDAGEHDRPCYHVACVAALPSEIANRAQYQSYHGVDAALGAVEVERALKAQRRAPLRRVVGD